jgi:hypothetical protein
MAKNAQAAAADPTTDIAVKTGGGAVALPDYLSGYAGPTGTENIDSGDVNIPRLKLAQGLTPEVKDGLVKDGDMFHSITKQVLIPVGQAGIVIPIAYVKEYILWRDMQDGGGIFARARRVVENGVVRYKWDHPNQTFEHKVKGVVKVKWQTKGYIDEDGLDKFGSSVISEPDSVPAANEHLNYIFMMPDAEEQLVAVSFSRTAASKAKDLNAMLKMGAAPMFARQFTLAAMAQKNDSGQEFYNYMIRPAGFVPSKDLFSRLQALHLEMRDKVQVDFSDEAKAGGAGNDGEDKGKW